MSRLNENYLKLPGSYLFAEIADRVASFKNEKPDADVISLGIGDVTKPLVPAVVEAIHKAADEMGQEDTFRGYGPYQGYDFLAEKIIKHDFNRYGIELSTDEIFISDGRAKKRLREFSGNIRAGQCCCRIRSGISCLC